MVVTEKLPRGTKVRFTEDYIANLDEQKAKRLKGRTGEISSYRLQVTRPGEVPLPIVVFPQVGRSKEIKLNEVDWRHLELVTVEQGGE